MRALVREILVTGAAASVASAVTLAAFGRKETGDAWAPLNGPSQWIWGKHAPYRNGFSVKYTVVGYAIHHLASTFWAVLHVLGKPGAPDPLGHIKAAAASALVAATVDYGPTPERLTPGFQKRLSLPALGATYLAFGAGLAIASILLRRR